MLNIQNVWGPNTIACIYWFSINRKNPPFTLCPQVLWLLFCLLTSCPHRKLEMFCLGWRLAVCDHLYLHFDQFCNLMYGMKFGQVSCCYNRHGDRSDCVCVLLCLFKKISSEVVETCQQWRLIWLVTLFYTWQFSMTWDYYRVTWLQMILSIKYLNKNVREVLICVD